MIRNDSCRESSERRLMNAPSVVLSLSRNYATHQSFINLSCTPGRNRRWKVYIRRSRYFVSHKYFPSDKHIQYTHTRAMNCAGSSLLKIRAERFCTRNNFTASFSLYTNIYIILFPLSRAPRLLPRHTAACYVCTPPLSIIKDISQRGRSCRRHLFLRLSLSLTKRK